MKRLNVFATKEELAECIKLLKEAQNTPVIAFSVGHRLSTGGLAGEAWTRVKQTCHKFALKHKLPEIPGYYGLDGKTGEFVEA